MTTLQKLEAAIKKLDERAKRMLHSNIYDGYHTLCDERYLLQEAVARIRGLESKSPELIGEKLLRSYGLTA